MDDVATNMELLYEKAKNYTKTSIELFRLNAIEKTADVVSSLISRLVIIMIVAMFTLFVNIALSLFIGKVLGEYYLGFLIVSGFYLIIALILIFYSNKLMKIPITNLIIAKLLKTKAKITNSNTSNDETI